MVQTSSQNGRQQLEHDSFPALHDISILVQAAIMHVDVDNLQWLMYVDVDLDNCNAHGQPVLI